MPITGYAVDFSGTGRRDLMHNVPDVLASTANFLKSYGWRLEDVQPISDQDS
jgi:membrane-bound lytic murein transglycosylase B